MIGDSSQFKLLVIRKCPVLIVVIYTFIINIARIEQTYFETNLHPFQNL